MRALDLVDVFVYLVVLGLFTQFFPAVITETFVLALFTAILLKLALELVLVAKKAIMGRIRDTDSPARRVVSILALVLLLPGSKFVVLELVALVFRGSVQLGGFFQVTLLIVVLMLARGGMRRLFDRAPGAV